MRKTVPQRVINYPVAPGWMQRIPTTALYDIRALEAWLIAEDYNAPRLIDLVAERARRKAGQP